MNRNVLTIPAVVLLLAAGAFSQTTLNPDISASGDFRAFGHNDDARTDEAEQFNLADPQLELMIGGYLNPYARADAVIAWHEGHDAAIEEVYATVLRGLPLGTNLRVGKYLLEFGRLNPVHPHAYSFIQRPLPHETLLGEEGLSDMAVRASFLLPTGSAYTELMFGVLKGDALEGHMHEHEAEAEEDADEEEVTERRDPGFFGRLCTSLALSEHAELALGSSVVNAVYDLHQHEETDPVKQLRAWIAGGDLKYKHRSSRYSALQIEAEMLMRRNEQDEGEALTSYGGYGYLDYRFRQKYNLGGIFEYLRHKERHEHEGEEEPEVHEADTWRAGLFTGFAPIEETSLVRLAGHWTKPEEQDGFWEVTLQLVISLGPHKPHNF